MHYVQWCRYASCNFQNIEGVFRNLKVINDYFKTISGHFLATTLISFEPIKIQTSLSPQNDRLNLSFVKDIHVVGEKMARNGRKMDI